MRGCSNSCLLLLLITAPFASAQVADETLFQNIRNNDLAGMKQQFAQDANVKGRRDVTPLLYAAAFGTADAVKLLIDLHADVNAKNSFDATALIWGATDVRKVRLLLDAGANVNAATKQGRTALMVASACDGCAEIVRLLLEKGADAKAKDGRGTTPLTLAAAAGDLESMRLLLAKGADPKAAADGGGTPLMDAVSNCNLKAVELLIARGATADSHITFAGTVKFGPIALVGLTPLMSGSAFCHADVVQALLKAGADVKAHDVRNMTALMLAVSSEIQDPAVVRLLIKAGSDLNVKSLTGETALDWARKFGNPEVIAALGGKVIPPPSVAKSDQSVTPADSLQKSTALLQKSAVEFFAQSGCAGCHHQPMAVMASAAVHAAGLPVDQTRTQALLRMMEEEIARTQENLLQRIDPGGAGDGEAYFLPAMAAAGLPAGAATDAAARHLAQLQRRAGNWHLGDVSRSPMQESDIARTARGIRALQAYAPPSLKPDFARRVLRAKDWLTAAKPVTADDRAMKLVGLHWGGVTTEQLKPQAKDLLAEQRADGGWAPNRNLASDAFATGESLWALRECGLIQPDDPAYKRGVEYLLKTQAADGSWHVASRAPKFQPYFQSGFPYEHDQWISSAATAWATMAISAGIEKEKRAAK